MEEFLTLNNQCGIDPITNLLLKDRLERVRQIFRNIEDVAQESGTNLGETCLLYTSPSPRDATLSRMPSSA